MEKEQKVSNDQDDAEFEALELVLFQVPECYVYLVYSSISTVHTYSFVFFNFDCGYIYENILECKIQLGFWLILMHVIVE